MKKLKVFVLALMLTLLTAIPALADQVNVYQNNQLIKSVVFKIGVSEFVVNGQTPGVKMDVAPFIQSDRTFVPVRFLGYALGLTEKDITWDNTNQKATMRGPVRSLEMAVGTPAIITMPTAKLLNNTLEIADRKVDLIDVAPVLKSDRTFLPARFVAEGLGYQVAWDEATQTVVCWPQGQTKPDVSDAVEYLISQPVQTVTPPAQPQPEPTQSSANYNLPPRGKLIVGPDGGGGPATGPPADPFNPVPWSQVVNGK